MNSVVEIPVTVKGMVASFERSYLSVLNNTFISKQTVSKRIYGGLRHGQFETVVVDKSILQNYGNLCMVGLGALKFLSVNNPFIKFKFLEVEPKRTKVLNEFEIPNKLREHPKFLLNGKPRDYFFEALEQCRTNPLGSIKLPTQSGKTSIFLTLAHNLRGQIGTGVIFVSSDNLRKQLIRRTEEYGIDNVITYEDYAKGSIKRTPIDKTLDWIIVLTPQLFNSRVKSGTFESDIFKWVIYDECHHVSSPTGQMIFYVMQNVVRAYGFSASPTKKEIPLGNLTFNKIDYEDALRISSFGIPLYERKTSDMISQGNTNKTILINYVYRWSPDELSMLEMQFNSLSNVKFNPCDYSHLLELLALNKERMNVISEIQSIINESGRNSMLNITRRKYGFSMLDGLNRSDTVLWYGSGKVYENTLLMTKLKDFNAKEFNPYKESSYEMYSKVYESSVLNTETLNQYYGTQIRNIIATSSVGSEGVSFDVPIDSAILSEGKGSNTILVIQRAGRTASANNDKVSIVINIIDKNAPGVLNKHSTMRMTSLKKEYGTKNVTFDNLVDLKDYIKKVDSGLIKV